MSDDAINFNIFVDARLPLRSFKAGETIFKEGDPATEFYCIQSGRVGIHLHTVEANGIFGEMSLIENTPRAPPLSPRLMSRLLRFRRKGFCSASVRRPSSRSRSCARWPAGCALR